MDTKSKSTLKIKQPSPLYYLAFGELCERFSYYGTLTILALYLSNVFQFVDDKSYSIYGVYATFAFGIPIVGGILADRFLGLKKAIILGALFLIMGNVLLAIPNFKIFSMGLALCVIGVGLYKPNSTILVGKLYSPNDPRRESGFTIFYMAMNIGGMLGPIVYGLFIHSLGWHYGFYTSAVLTTFGIILFLSKIDVFTKNYVEIPKLNIQPLLAVKTKLLVYLSLIITTSIITLTLYRPNLLSFLLIGFCIIVAGGLTIIIRKYSLDERKRIIGLIILSSFAMFFFAASLQVVSSISLFINRDIDRSIFGWTIPTTMFSSLYPFAVILIAPFLTGIWSYLALNKREPSIPTKLSLSLLLASIGFICFSMAAISSQNLLQSFYPIAWIVIGNLCLGTGELCLMPTIFSAISRFAPSNLQSTMIGVLFLFIASAGYLSSLIAKISNNSQVVTSKLMAHQLSVSIYNHTFIEISIITFVFFVLFLLLTPWIKSLIKPQDS